MLNLREFLKEEKNTHMEHLEDLVFNEGVAGTRKAIDFLRDLRDMLAGHSVNKLATTVKWDGAPAIFAGIDPRDGKFFVAKKGVFNKEPKVYKTQQDIDSELEGELNAKFSIALQEFSKLGITSGVYQGDLMFTQGDVKTETIDGVSYKVFHPNTIAYAVPSTSTLGQQIAKAKIGVVWHTTYVGKTFETMKATFGKGIVEKFKSVPSIWMDDATYKDVSGTATFTAHETEQVTQLLSAAGKLFQSLNREVVDGISKDEDLLMAVKTFNNSKVRAGQKITDPAAHVTELFNYIHNKYQKEIDSKKTQASKDTWEAKRKKVMSFFANNHKDDIVKVFELTNLLTDAKHMIIDKMNAAGHIKTFLKTASGFKTTGVEGFVAIDHLKGGAVKIVNRMEFSKANFSPEIIKGWQR